MIRILPCLFVLLTCGCASVQEARTLGRYDFSYRIEGDARAAPLQIFDDGKHTFLQLRDTVPTIFAVDSEGTPILLPTRRDGQYVVADRIERELIFLVEQDKGRASARYIGKQNRAVLPHELAALSEPTPPAPIERLSHKVPFPKDGKRVSVEGRRILEGLLPTAKAAARIAILDRPARDRRDRGVGHARSLAVRDWLVHQGIDADRIVLVKGTAVAPDYCELLFAPPGTARTLEMATPATAEKAGLRIHGAAVPVRVSLPVQPVFVDRGRTGATDVVRQ